MAPPAPRHSVSRRTGTAGSAVSRTFAVNPPGPGADDFLLAAIALRNRGRFVLPAGDGPHVDAGDNPAPFGPIMAPNGAGIAEVAIPLK